VAVLPVLPPGPTPRRLQREHDIGAQPRALVSAAYASRASLPPPMQGSLPAGGLRLCREGVEPSGTRWKVSDYIILLPRASPVASWMVLDGAIKAPDLLRFLARLVRDADRKVFLILDRLPVHRSAKVRDWLVGREAEIEKWRPWCMLNPFRVAGSASGVLTALA